MVLTPPPPLHDAVLFVDSGTSVTLDDGDRIGITGGEVRARFARVRQQALFPRRARGQAAAGADRAAVPADTRPRTITSPRAGSDARDRLHYLSQGAAGQCSRS